MTTTQRTVHDLRKKHLRLSSLHDDLEKYQGFLAMGDLDRDAVGLAHVCRMIDYLRRAICVLAGEN